MTYISQASSSKPPQWENLPRSKGGIQLQIDNNLYSPEVVANRVTSLEGPVDVYCWYEGQKYLPKSGADFMRPIFESIYRKKDAKLYPYSLKAWEFQKNALSLGSPTTRLGEAINSINTAAVECIYSSSFFQYCAAKRRGPIYEYLNEKLPQKKWLFTLSENKKDKDIKIGELFNKNSSLLDCLQDMDIAKAYSPMQYIEGYYLIQESIKKGLQNKQKKIQIAFVLPNDEGKYYRDYPKDIPTMLQLDFGEYLSGVEINISFQFFEFGNSLNARPYIDTPPQVKVKDIPALFSYLLKPPLALAREIVPRPFLSSVSKDPIPKPSLSFVSMEPRRVFPQPRDVIHKLNMEEV